MALPSNVGKGIVTFNFKDTSGDPLVGEVIFTPEFKSLKNVTGAPKTIILPKETRVTLNASGGGSVSLVATDDEDNNPIGWTYLVTSNFEGVDLKPFSISVAEGTTKDLSQLQPLYTHEGVPALTGPGVAFGGLLGQVLAKLSNADYDTGWIDIDSEGGGGAVASVNGKTGIVVLNAADVNARPNTYVPSWDQVTGKPTVFPPEAHLHTGIYSPVGHTHTGVYSPVGHTHTTTQISDSTALGRNLMKVSTVDAAQALLDLDNVDLSNAPPIYQARSVSDTEAKWKTELNGDLELELMDIAQHWVNGLRVAWQNEWGALRGTSPHEWGDALVRGIREDWDNLVAGRYIELVDRRATAYPSPYQVMHGRKWRDGMLVRNGIDMSDCWVRNGTEAIPAYLPEGTIVVQI